MAPKRLTSRSTSSSTTNSTISSQLTRDTNNMAPKRLSSRSTSPSNSTISSRSTVSSSNSLTPSTSSSSSSYSSSSSSSSSRRQITLPQPTNTHFVFITGLPNHVNNKQAVSNIIRRFLPRLPITQFTAISEGIVIQSPIPIKQELVNIIGTAQFGPKARITSKIPQFSNTMSVMIRGVNVELTDEEIRNELKVQKLMIDSVIRIMIDRKPTFMVKVTSDNSDTIEKLLYRGVRIGKKWHRVEPTCELAGIAAAAAQ